MAKGTFKLKGVDKFMRNFDKEVRQLRGRTLDGMIAAVIELQREAEPGTPIDTGNLRASWFTVSIRGEEKTQIVVTKFEDSQAQSNHRSVKARAQSAVKELNKFYQPVVLFGYTANYAVFVHENVDAKFKRPGAKARWLYLAMQTSRQKMLNAIAEKAKF